AGIADRRERGPGGAVRREGSGRGSAAPVDPGDRQRDPRRGRRAHGRAAVLAAPGVEGAPGRRGARALARGAQAGERHGGGGRLKRTPVPGERRCPASFGGTWT